MPEEVTERDPVPGLTSELVVGKTIPLLKHWKLHENDDISMRTTA